MNPHCPDCAHCKSCEVLSRELSQVRQDYDKLLNELLRKPEDDTRPQIQAEPQKPKHIPWAVKRQILEEEDREKARILRNIEKVEKELKLEIPQEVNQ